MGLSGPSHRRVGATASGPGLLVAFPECGPRAAYPRATARTGGHPEIGIGAGQWVNIPGMYLRHPASEQHAAGVSSNFLAALGRRLERICAPRANRAQGRPKPGMGLGRGVLNPC